MILLVYSLIILLVQTVVLPRWAFLGAAPDLILVSVIILSILPAKQKKLYYAAAMGFFQDILLNGAYLNTITKVSVSIIIDTFKDNFIGNEYRSSMLLVLAFTPLVLIAEAAALFFVFDKQIGLFYLIKTIILTTAYNALLAAVLFPVLQKISHE